MNKKNTIFFVLILWGYFVGCMDDDIPATTDSLSDNLEQIYALGSDYQTSGILTVIDLPDISVNRSSFSGVVSTDPVLRYYAERLYIINRFSFDNVTILDALTHQLISQRSTGAGTNPQDIAVFDNKIYVALLNAGHILVFDDLENEQSHRIDISDYDDDQIPNCSSLYVVGDRLFAVLSRYDENFKSKGSTVLVIDTNTDQIVHSIELSHSGPVTLFQQAPDNDSWRGDLFIATAPDFMSTSGCIHRITPIGNASSECFVSNNVLGGYVSAISFREQYLFAAINQSDASFQSTSRIVRLSDDRVITEIGPAFQGINPTDITQCSSGLFVMNDITTGGIYIVTEEELMRTEDVADIEQAIDIGQPSVYSSGLFCAPKGML